MAGGSFAGWKKDQRRKQTTGASLYHPKNAEDEQREGLEQHTSAPS
jgi:hypothetical protein